MSELTRAVTARTRWWTFLTQDNEPSREWLAFVARLVLAGWVMLRRPVARSGYFRQECPAHRALLT